MSPTQRGPADADAPVVLAAGPEIGDPAGDVAAADAVALGASAELIAASVGDYARIWLQRVRNGESGALPVVLGLAAVVIYFQVRNSLFLSAGNLVNLMVLSAPFIIFGMAEIFVLLLGEIDLSVGYNAGIGAVVTLWAAYTLPWWVAIIIGLASTAFIGAVQGTLITRLGLPSFVVTLAGLLGLQGLMQILVARSGHGAGGSINIPSNILDDLTSGNLSPLAGWVVMVGNANRGVGLTVLSGVPWVVPIVLGVLVLFTVLTGRTRFGRYIYAIGGNAEAARRAGVNLATIRTLAFTLCGLTAGIGGILLASQLNSIGTTLNGGQYVLFAVASAVIGGTNLFGGRGRMLHAVLGGLVVATIANGLALIGMTAAATDIITAIVLLAAVTIDTVARRSRVAS